MYSENELIRGKYHMVYMNIPSKGVGNIYYDGCGQRVEAAITIICTWLCAQGFENKN